MKPPQIKYARGPEGRVAYQTVGDGPIDLVFMPFFGRWNLDIVWEHPPLERFLRRLASFSRLVLFNPRGTGVSDPVPVGRRPTVEDWMLDARLVLDTIGSERTALLAIEGSSPVAALFAATFPERTLALAILNGFASVRRTDGYPWGFPPEALDRFGEAMVTGWGTGQNLDFMAPDLAKDSSLQEWWARLERLTGSPAALATAFQWDVRGVLASIKAPTLVIAHTDVRWIRLGHGHYLAEHIPGARYLERSGHWGGVYWVDDVDWVLSQVGEFFTGAPGAPDPDDRVLATVLFVDIVGSTERAAALGDRQWRELLEAFYTTVRRELGRFRGREIDTAGDGFLAAFDGPARAIRCACSIGDSVRLLGMNVRAGLHTGECEPIGEKLGGIAVHIAARITAFAAPTETLVSSTVRDLVTGAGFRFHDRGIHVLRGIPGEWRLLAVERPEPTAAPNSRLERSG